MKMLIEAAKAGDAASLTEALACGGDPNERDDTGWTALHWASQEGYESIVSDLIGSGALVNLQDPSGITPLALAVGQERKDVVATLLRHGADPHLRIAAYGNGSALHLACAWGQLEMVRLLVGASAERPNERDDEGMTPLDHAESGGFSSVAHYLREHGAGRDSD